jgi:hypothetical protein
VRSLEQVRESDLQRFVGLRKSAFDRFPDEAFLIVGRERESDKRPFAIGRDFRLRLVLRESNAPFRGIQCRRYRLRTAVETPRKPQ